MYYNSISGINKDLNNNNIIIMVTTFLKKF